jgi:hypothetical protein
VAPTPLTTRPSNLASRRALALLLVGQLGCTLTLDTELSAPPNDADAHPDAVDASSDGPRPDGLTGDLSSDTDGARDLGVDDGPVADLSRDTASDVMADAVEPPGAPAEVTASDGDSSEAVTVTWQAVEGARSYTVHRDDVLVARDLTDLVFEDTGATGAVPTAEGFRVVASDGLYADRVEVTWSTPDVPDSPVHEYRVGAVNAAGAGPLSEPDTGYRDRSPVLEYEVQVGDGPWESVGRNRFFTDAESLTPLPTEVTEPGDVEASDGTALDHVRLELTGTAHNDVPAEVVSYRVRAINATGTGEASSPATGYRTPAPGLQWQRSQTTNAAGTYVDIPGADTAVHDDVEGPLDESVRHYRCLVSDAETEVAVGPDSGYRVTQDIESSGPVTPSGLGDRVDVSGGRAVAAAWGSQSLHFFEFLGAAEGWVETDAFSPAMGVLDVSIEGDWAAASEPDWNAVQFYRVDPETGDWEAYGSGSGGGPDYAENIVMDGNRLISADPGERRAVIHRRSDDEPGGPLWGIETDLPAQREDGDFGHGVDLDGTRAIVGGDDEISIFENASGDGWSAIYTTDEGDLLGSGELGSDVALAGSWALAGDALAGLDGVVHVFHEDGDGWALVGTILPASGTPDGARFGDRVALRGRSAFISDPASQRVTYFWLLDDGWTLRETLESPDTEDPSYGSDVGFDGTVLLIGGPLAGETDKGILFAYWPPS